MSLHGINCVHFVHRVFFLPLTVVGLYPTLISASTEIPLGRLLRLSGSLLHRLLLFLRLAVRGGRRPIEGVSEAGTGVLLA